MRVAYQKNLVRAMEKQNPFPVQRLIWDKIYEKGNLKEAARAIGKNPELLSNALDGKYDLKWSTVKALCRYLEIDNPLEVML